MVRREIVKTGERVEVRLVDDEHSEPGCVVLEREEQAVKNKIARCSIRRRFRKKLGWPRLWAFVTAYQLFSEG